MSRIPDSYKPGRLRNVTPVCSSAGRIGVGFDLGIGQPLRLTLSVADAASLANCIRDLLMSEQLRGAVDVGGVINTNKG